MVSLTLLSLAGAPAQSQEEPGPIPLVEASERFLALLNADERRVALLPFDTPRRLDWGCGERLYRRGLALEFAVQNAEVRHALSPLLNALAVSPVLDPVLVELGDETETKPLAARSIGDEAHLTFFGRPAPASRWGLSLEGPRISWNFVVDRGRIVSSTPQMISWREKDFADGRGGMGSPPYSRRDAELVATFSAPQARTGTYREFPAAIIASEGEGSGPLAPPLGLPYGELDPIQQELRGGRSSTCAACCLTTSRKSGSGQSPSTAGIRFTSDGLDRSTGRSHTRSGFRGRRSSWSVSVRCPMNSAAMERSTPGNVSGGAGGEISACRSWEIRTDVRNASGT